MAMASTLQAHPLHAGAEPDERVPAFTDDDGSHFFRGLAVGLTLSGFLYAGLGALLVSLF
jgi:hypothetical protein